jgi:hypothetical protein
VHAVIPAIQLDGLRRRDYHDGGSEPLCLTIIAFVRPYSSSSACRKSVPWKASERSAAVVARRSAAPLVFAFQRDVAARPPPCRQPKDLYANTFNRQTLRVAIHVLLEGKLRDVLSNADIDPSWLLCIHADTA